MGPRWLLQAELSSKGESCLWPGELPPWKLLPGTGLPSLRRVWGGVQSAVKARLQPQVLPSLVLGLREGASKFSSTLHSPLGISSP